MPQQNVVIEHRLDAGDELSGQIPETWRLSWIEWATSCGDYGLQLDGMPNPLAGSWKILREAAATDAIAAAVLEILRTVVPEVQ